MSATAADDRTYRKIINSWCMYDSQLAGESRLSILSLFVFFLVGGLILTQVNVKEGIRMAQQKDAELGLVPAS